MAKQKHNLKKQAGIALIITIILTSIMLTAVVLVSKEMVDEIKNSTRIDNSLIAYYAAEAGLEDALLAWRYDHDAEISQEKDRNHNVDVTCVPLTHPCTPRMVDLTDSPTATKDNYVIDNSTTKDLGKSYYELTMWNKVPSVVNQTVLQDNVAEFEIPNMTQPVKLEWTPNPVTDPLSGYRVEITVYNENGDIVEKQFDKPEQQPSFIVDPNDIGGPGKKIIRVRPWYTKAFPESDGFTFKEGSLPLPGNSIPSINLSINQSSVSDLISGTVTHIESVGYFGGVARKIVATLDRSSGSIIGINDFAIYSGSNLIK